jgi:glycosyltransferase involved in cell wall biosynthesis
MVPRKCGRLRYAARIGFCLGPNRALSLKISVLTVAFNSAATISYTVDSFLAQDHAEKEMILIDGASTDGTVNIVRNYCDDRIVIVSEPDTGMYDALNKALNLYSGDVVGVLNSDDAYHDEFVLSRVAKALETTDIAHGHLNFVDGHETKIVKRRWRATPRPQRGFRTGWMPAHPTFYVRRSVADRAGHFDLSFRTASDYDWMLRAIELHNHSTCVIDAVMIDMMQGGQSTSSLLSHINHNLEALRSRRRWLGSGFVDYALIAKPMRKIGQWVSTGRSPTLYENRAAGAYLRTIQKCRLRELSALSAVPIENPVGTMEEKERARVNPKEATKTKPKDSS